MGGHDHCAMWGCDNDWRYKEKWIKMKHVNGPIRFFSRQNPKNFMTWTKLIIRVGFKATSSTRICSNHFDHGRPTLDSPHPTLYRTGYPDISCSGGNNLFPERKAVKRKPFAELDSNVAKRRKPSEPKSPLEMECFRKGFDDNKSQVIVTPPPSDDHCYEIIASEDSNDCARCREFPNCGQCRERIDGYRKNCVDLEMKLHEEMRRNVTLVQELDYMKNKPFRFEDIEKDDNLVEFYTGLQNSASFHFLLSKISPKTPNLQYYKGVDSFTVKNYQVKKNQEKPGKKRLTSPMQELFLTLCRLRQGLSLQDIAYPWKISVGSVSTILSTWIPFLARELEALIYWPTRKKVLTFYPSCFKPFPHMCSIIDCTEIYLDRQSLAESQALSYSSYKSHNTAKYLLSITPAGAVSFISKGYGGMSSDRFIFENCGILDTFEPATSCMVDRGLVIQDLLSSKQVKVYMPPFTKGQPQFTKNKVRQGQQIARARIHVERAIERVKRFKIFKSVIPLTMVDILDDMIIVCAALTNLMPPLIRSKN